MTPIAALLNGLIDYAGLFPPSKLPMNVAVGNFASYLRGAQAGMLGRFIVPISRLAEFEAEYSKLNPESQVDWRLSVLSDASPESDHASIVAFNGRHRHARIVSVEAKAPQVSALEAIARTFPPVLEVWIEIPAGPDPARFLDVIQASGRGVKIRTGGITQDAFPAPEIVSGFLQACHQRGVVAKATAGLHHPLCGDYRLSQEPNAPTGRMFGFLNVFLAATLLQNGGTVDSATRLLVDATARNFAVTDDALSWCGHRFSTAQITSTRRALLRSYGSCSFTEPIEGLQALHWL